MIRSWARSSTATSLDETVEFGLESGSRDECYSESVELFWSYAPLQQVCAIFPFLLSRSALDICVRQTEKASCRPKRVSLSTVATRSQQAIYTGLSYL